jgi:hypothetical protein
MKLQPDAMSYFSTILVDGSKIVLASGQGDPQKVPQTLDWRHLQARRNV